MTRTVTPPRTPLPAHLAARLAACRDRYDQTPAGIPGEADLAARLDLAAELAALTLAAPVGARVGPLTKARGGWTAELAARADDAAEPGTPAWYEELGAHTSAVLTADGGGAIPGQWCEHAQPRRDIPPAQWVRYEVWHAAGMTAHGYVHADLACRRLVQSG